MKELEGLLKQDGKVVFSYGNPMIPVFIVLHMLKYYICFTSFLVHLQD